MKQKDEFRGLRRKAEKEVRKSSGRLKAPVPADSRTLVHELETHQIELEMQKEELRRAQQGLEESRRNYADLYELAPVGYFVLNAKGVVTSVNCTGAQILGFEKNAIVGLPLSAFVLRKHARPFFRHLLEVLSGPGKHMCEIAVRRRDKQIVHVQLQSLAAEAKGGGRASIRTALIDVTNLKRAEEELYATNERLQALMRAVPVGVSFSDDTTCRRITGNPALFAQFEITPSDNISASVADPGAAGRKVLYFRDGHPIEASQLPLQRAVAENRVIEPTELEVVLPTGRRWIAEASGAPVRNADGKVVAGLAVTAEITERKRIERELQQAVEELERSNKELEQFAYLASHDLQEPLRAVTGFLTLLEERGAEKLDAKSREYIGFAVEGATRMSQLIHDLLDYSRLGRKSMNPVPIDTGIVLAKALANAESSIREATAAVTHDALPTIKGDPTQLIQLFQNLISNAVKFRSPERPCRVHVGVEKREDQWVFSVCDNGIGIPSEQYERIFKIFQRLHTRDKYPGTGIGLAICKKIVERHGGQIWVDSVPGEGSTFKFSLPA